MVRKAKNGAKGDTGDQGIQGMPGLDGKSLEFHWNGTQLGVRIEEKPPYQYLNLKGDKGNQGIQGYTRVAGYRRDKRYRW